MKSTAGGLGEETDEVMTKLSGPVCASADLRRISDFVNVSIMGAAKTAPAAAFLRKARRVSPVLLFPLSSALFFVLGLLSAHGHDLQVPVSLMHDISIKYSLQNVSIVFRFE